MLGEASWFRRYFGFSFIPVSRKGYAATLAFLLVEAALAFLSFRAAHDSPAWWLLAVAMFAIFLAFWALALSKMSSS
jgi:hypothetical protein